MTAVPGAAALDGLAILLQFFVVVSNDFFGSVVRGEFPGYDFQRKSRYRKVDVRALLVVTVVFRRGLGARVHRQAGIANISLLADVQIADGRLDVNVLIAIL